MSGAPEAAVIANRYRVERKIATGGMATVLLARDIVLEREVAIKLLAEHLMHDSDFVLRFQHEARAVARLQHPNIVQVFDTGVDQATGRHYIAMEYVNGTTLSDVLKQHPKIDSGRAVEIASDACAALFCAHSFGIIHRDVKTANLLISAEGVTKLADFGIAKAAENTKVTQTGSVLGTVSYLSPEQAAGNDTGAASDIYSLAVCVYQMLAGRMPFEYKSITELAIKQREHFPPPITEFSPDVPEALDRAVQVALSYNPADRYATAEQFKDALQAGLRGHTDMLATQLIARRSLPGALPVGTAGQAAGEPTVVVPGGAVAGQQNEPAYYDPEAAAYGNLAEPGPQQKKSRGPVALILSVLVLAAGGLAAYAYTDSQTRPVAPVLKGDVTAQIGAMRQQIETHRR